jgi:hypothetical protein
MGALWKWISHNFWLKLLKPIFLFEEQVPFKFENKIPLVQIQMKAH